MDGFKDSTKVQYMKGGKVGTKGAAKIAKVMGEFKRGELHSGSKKGPEVTNRKQAVAIAMSEARKAGSKAPVKKANGGPIMEGISTRPVDAKGRRMPIEMVAIEQIKTAPKMGKGIGAIDAALAAAKKTLAAKAPASTAARGATAQKIEDARRGVEEARRAAGQTRATVEAAMKKAEATRKGVPTFGMKPMLERAKGGLACMPGRKR